jgi:hypothetical protein
MGGERHAGAARVDYDPHQYRHRGGRATVPVVVGRDPLAGCGREASPHRVTQPGARHVEVGLVQPGVRGVRQVLGHSRGTHREPICTQAARQASQPGVQVRIVESRGGHHDPSRHGETGGEKLGQHCGLAAEHRPVRGAGLGEGHDRLVGFHRQSHM